MEYLISVVIPFYCTPSELFIRCMNSILLADLEDIEILIIDDGSSEEYFEIVDQYNNNPQIRIIRTRNMGVSSARNRGILEAKGKWILFVDSDDYVDPQSLRKIEHYAKSHKGDVVIVSGGRDDNGKIDYNTNFLIEGLNYAANDRDKTALMESALSVGILPIGYKQYFSLGAPYCKLLSVDYLRNNNLLFNENVKFAEDTLFSLQIYLSANDIRYLDVNLYYYVNNTQSVTRRFRPGLSKDMDVFFEKTNLFLKENRVATVLERAYLIRAEFEVTRVFYLEFFNPKNRDSNNRRNYFEFIEREPYCSALKANYLPVGNFKQRVFKLLVHTGKGNAYILLKNVNSRLRRIMRNKCKAKIK